MAIFNSYVSLPEGTANYSWVLGLSEIVFTILTMKNCYKIGALIPHFQTQPLIELLLVIYPMISN